MGRVFWITLVVMSKWIICLPREDMEHCIQIGTFGLSSKQSLSRVKIGDEVSCCVTREKPWKLIAFGKATSELFIDDAPVFRKEGRFYYRFSFDAVRLDSGKEVDLQQLLPSLSFVSNILHWPIYFKGGIKSISEEDWRRLLPR